MRRLNQFVAPLAAVPLLLTATACTEEAMEPPPSGVKLCGVTVANWWYDATGGDDLSYTLDGELPPPRPTQSRYTTGRTS